MLKELGPQEWFFKELADITKMNFRFGDKQRPVEYVLELSNVMSVSNLAIFLSFPSYVLHPFSYSSLTSFKMYFFRCLLTEIVFSGCSD